MFFIRFVLLLLTVTSLSSCNSSRSSKNQLIISAIQKDILNVITNRGLDKGVIVTKSGETISVKEYDINKSQFQGKLGSELLFMKISSELGSPLVVNEEATTLMDKYWVFFYKGQAIAWGEVCSLKQAEEALSKIDFNSIA